MKNCTQAFLNKSLMIFDDQIFYYNGKDYSSEEAHVLYMIGLRKYFNNLTFCSRLHPKSHLAPYKIPQKIKLCPLPYYHDVVEFYKKAYIYIPKIWKILRKNVIEWDIILMSWPNPVSLMTLILIKITIPRKFTVLVVRQNLQALVRLRYKSLKRIFALIMVDFLDWQAKFWARSATIFTVSDEMYSKFKCSFENVHEFKDPLISNSDILKLNFSNNITGKHLIYLLFVGRMEPEKGLPVLIQCVALLKKQNVKVHLTLVGSGPYEEQLRQLVNNLNVSEEISFKGYVKFGESLFSYYKSTDFFILPSFSEGFPRVLMEAMVFGLPIITTSVGDIPNVIKHRENGWLVTSGKPDAFADAIIELSNNPRLTQSIKEKAKKDAFLYTMEAQQEKLVKTMGAYIKQ